MKTILSKQFGLTNTRETQWVIIEEINSGYSDIFLGIKYRRSKVAVKLCERRFVSEVTLKNFDFKRVFYPAVVKKKKHGKVIFEALKVRNENCEETLAIEKTVNFVLEEYGDLCYSKELENKKLV